MSERNTTRALAFDEARARIEAGIGPQPVASGKPAAAVEFGLEKNERCVRLVLPHVDRTALPDVLEAVGKYFTVARFDFHWSNEFAFTVNDAGLRGEEAPERTRFRFRPDRGGLPTIVELKKDTDLSERDVECVLDLWKRLAPEGENSPAEMLEALGARVYHAERRMDLGARGRLRGDEDRRRDHRRLALPARRRLPRGRPAGPRKAGVEHSARGALRGAPRLAGKTTMARVVANVAKVPLIYVPIESVMSMYYGESERRLAAMFEQAQRFDRCLFFLDEIDALAGSRDKLMHEATRRVLSVLLRNLQGIAQRDNVLVIGATNRAVDLDRALLSRFNRIVRFDLPNAAERAQIPPPLCQPPRRGAPRGARREQRRQVGPRPRGHLR